jgi:Asp-tRNA(Asn)/Glu-tRNA(Gln) amidotransferase A subunit family amidase
MAEEADAAFAATRARPHLLSGFLFAVSDTVETDSHVMTAGLEYLDEWRPAETCALVSLVASTGATCMGKTNVHSLGYGYTGANADFGGAKNVRGGWGWGCVSV